MSYIINESISGISLFCISEEEKTIELKSKYEYADTDEAIESIKKMKDHVYTDKIIKFLKKEIDNNDISFYVNDKDSIKYLKSHGINGCYSPSVYHQFKSYIHKNDRSLLSSDELINRTKYIANELSSSSIQNNNDILLIQSVKLFDYLEKEINMHCMRIKEFYGMHFPELSDIVSDNEKYLRVMMKIGNKDTLITEESSDESEDKENEQNRHLNDKNKKEAKSNKRHKNENCDKTETDKLKMDEYYDSILSELRKLASTSIGSFLSSDDLSKINADAMIVLQEIEHRVKLSEYIKNLLTEIAPNALSLIGQNVLCKMIIKAGGIKELSKMAASTLQILGAEKALFSSLKSSINQKVIRTPKYGILFHTSLVSNTVPVYKGRMARTVAAKLAICLRADYFSFTNEKKKKKSNLGVQFYAQLEQKRIKMNEENGSAKKSNKGIVVEKRKKK